MINNDDLKIKTINLKLGCKNYNMTKPNFKFQLFPNYIPVNQAIGGCRKIILE